MKELKLENSKETISVDDEDVNRLSQYKWYLMTRAVGRLEYLNGKTVTTPIQNQVMSDFENTIDHKDRNIFNNEKYNLRVATTSQNSANKEKPIFLNATSIYKGVHRDKLKWRARIKINGKKIHLGYFKTQLEAALAYDKKAIELFGEFACLNFPTQ